MIVDLHSVDACGRESYRDQYKFLMEVGWGVVHEYPPVVERNSSMRETRGEVVLGWNIVKEGMCGYVMDRTVGWPEGMIWWVAVVVKTRAGVEKPRIPTGMGGGDVVAPGGLESQVSYRQGSAPEIVKGIP